MQNESTPGGQAAYYWFSEQSQAGNGAVRVIMLDDTGEVDTAQVRVAGGQLQAAETAGEAAVAVGNADLNAQIAAGNNPGADAVAAALVSGGASAYFYDSPEENTEAPLRLAATAR